MIPDVPADVGLRNLVLTEGQRERERALREKAFGDSKGEGLSG